MSVAWYIVLEKQVAGLDSGLNGKAVGHAGTLLNSLAKEARVKPLMDFFATSPLEMSTFADDSGVEIDDSDLPSEKWFPAEDGLKTVSALIKAVKGKKLNRAKEILDDLRRFEQVLHAAAMNGVKWHLAVDF